MTAQDTTPNDKTIVVTSDSMAKKYVQSDLPPEGAPQTGTTSTTNPSKTENLSTKLSADGAPAGGGETVHADQTIYILKGKHYKAIRSISENSGEAQVTLVERKGEVYCLKLYYPNFRFNTDILRAVWNINFEMVVKLYDYGHTTINGVERDYELMEFLEGGTLAEYKQEQDEKKFKIITLQAAAALSAIHNYGIIHKDIKPGNYFFRDKEHTHLVLGDFGISAMMKENELTIRTSQARTPAFAAPEMYDDVIDGEVEIDTRVDYYSLGITLLYLWLGKSPFSKNERLMMRLKQEGRLPHIEDLPERVAMVIKGLTTINPIKRWGFEEVERWFRGEDVPVDTSSVFLRYKSFMVDPDRNLAAHDLKELVPLLFDNQQLAIQYLYSKRISTWLEECGNSKMAVILNDIVEHRYVNNQQAGLMAAIYAMEPNFPYYDINGKVCNSVQELTLTLLQNAKDYQYKLQDESDSLFVYIDMHTQCDVSRLRSYFQPADDKSVLRLVYEIDKSLPFLSTIKATSTEEIVRAFAEGNRTEDEWLSLTDGRVLAWLYNRADISVCEEVKDILSQPAKDQRTQAYHVLYAIEPTCGFDLQNATTCEQTGAVMAEALLCCQSLSDEEFAQQMSDYLAPNGRLAIYARRHNWQQTIQQMQEYLDLDSEANTERCCIYDLRTAAYKLCAAMGGQPAYEVRGIDFRTIIHDPSEMENVPAKDVLQSIRNNHMAQWISIFFHENPNADFQTESEYNHSLSDYLLTVGAYDGGEIHYKRYMIAKEEFDEKLNGSKNSWNQSFSSQRHYRIGFITISMLWIIMLSIFGIDLTDNMIQNIYMYMALIVGLPLGAMLATRGYFRGNGFTIGSLWVLGALLFSIIPAAILSFCLHNAPSLTRWVAVAMSGIFVGLGMKYAFQTSTVSGNLDGLKGAFHVDEEETLREILYYTFKSRTFKFRGSTFGLMEDAVGEAYSSSTERIINCVMWSMVPAFLILAMIWYHSSLLDHTGPSIAAWKQTFYDIWAQIKAL